jgi:6-phosphogluconolactonase
MNAIVSPDVDTLTRDAADRLCRRVRDIHAAGRRPRLLLTGGSVATELYRHVDAAAAAWSNVEFWWGDERFVPEDLPDRNDRQAREAFLDRVGATPALVHRVADNDCSLGAAEAAAVYAATLPEAPFDLALFGIGPDGHVASLFPGFPQLDETEADVVAVFDSPKPPPVRLTMTFPRLNRSAAVWFIVAGEDKADAVARAMAAHGDVHTTPARGVRGTAETLWLLDAAAAANL